MTALQSRPTPIASPILPATTTRIVLTGFMGAGKTCVGRLLAQALGWTFVDLDAHLEARSGASVAQLFAQHGEPHFRRLESAALANALSGRNVVLALGGGTPEQLRNRLLLEQTPGTVTVFLDAPFAVLFDRCMLQSFATPQHVRPLLTQAAEAAARFQARQPFYRRLAHVTVPTAALQPEAVAQRVQAALAG